MSAIGRRKLKTICNRFIEASRAWYAGTGRRMGKTLIGSPAERNAAVKRVQVYQALLRTTDPPKVRPSTRQACNFIASLRKNALDRKLSAALRCVSIARLMLQEGFEIERYWEPDAVDDLMAKHFTIKTKTESESYAPSTMYKRDAARRKALEEIRYNFILDKSEGRFANLTTPAEIASGFRLDDMPPVNAQTCTAVDPAALERLRKLMEDK